MKKDDTKMLTARVPSALVKQLDKAAEKSRRSRSSELVVRLQAGLGRPSSRSAA